LPLRADIDAEHGGTFRSDFVRLLMPLTSILGVLSGRSLEAIALPPAILMMTVRSAALLVTSVPAMTVIPVTIMIAALPS
jgi:hypothetical protein